MVPSRPGLRAATSSDGLTPLLPDRWHRAAASFGLQTADARGRAPPRTSGPGPQVALQRSHRWYACRDSSCWPSTDHVRGIDRAGPSSRPDTDPVRVRQQAPGRARVASLAGRRRRQSRGRGSASKRRELTGGHADAVEQMATSPGCTRPIGVRQPWPHGRLSRPQALPTTRDTDWRTLAQDARCRRPAPVVTFGPWHGAMGR